MNCPRGWRRISAASWRRRKKSTWPCCKASWSSSVSGIRLRLVHPSAARTGPVRAPNPIGAAHAMTFFNRGARSWCRCASLAVALWAIATAHAAGFSAILGGAGQDYAAAVATDSKGNVYVAGRTYSADFPTTPGALQAKIGSVGPSDAFVAKFTRDGVLLWSTFLGGSGDDWASGVAVDVAGNVLVTGWTRSADFPVFHAFHGTLNNGAPSTLFDAFVAPWHAEQWCAVDSFRCLRRQTRPHRRQAPLFHVPGRRGRRLGFRPGGGYSRERLRHRICRFVGQLPWHEELARRVRHLRRQTGSPRRAGLHVPTPLRQRGGNRRGHRRQRLRRRNGLFQRSRQQRHADVRRAGRRAGHGVQALGRWIAEDLRDHSQR